ncbi:hypothetical protein PYCCODRAFT_100568 [Trametes coccinea BRFM310]|uniref:Uncharacterized protein n=1 Tax=Trametes coccinea (strain BRFM310) TaxID=1353009 RepID=A0A1Y2ITK1_TRAC3|nr:hypothetical protein PYCCODRAFT_100568 [Trametes coccinea BRFM310]
MQGPAAASAGVAVDLPSISGAGNECNVGTFVSRRLVLRDGPKRPRKNASRTYDMNGKLYIIHGEIRTTRGGRRQHLSGQQQ